MVTHFPLPSAYHIGEQRAVGKGVVNEEGHVLLKLMMIGEAALIAKLLLGALVVLAMQP